MKRIGRYEVEEELARGGMGVVYRARDAAAGRSVALKVLRPDRLDESRRRRFAREVDAMAKLRHRNVVHVHAAGDDGGRPYLVMDLVEGRSLEEALREAGRLPPGEVTRIGIALARALVHAHGLGVLHRDLKPDNVLLDVTGEPLLTDFGLAREIAAPPSSLSKTGMVMGTPGYFAPEQARGERATSATDVYGLGALLYALLVGRPPFTGRSLVELIVATSEQPPLPPSAEGVELDPRLEQVVLRCLEKDPALRYASAAAALEALVATLQPAAGPSRLPHLAAGVGAALLFASAAAVLLPTDPAPQGPGGSGPAPAPTPTASQELEAPTTLSIETLRRRARAPVPFDPALSRGFERAVAAAASREAAGRLRQEWVGYLLRRARYAECVAVVDALPKAEETPTLLLWRVIANEHSRGLQARLNGFRAVERRFGGSAAARVAAAWIAAGTRDYRRALEIANGAAALPDALDLPQLGQVRARALNNLGRKVEAVRVAESEALRFPDDPMTLDTVGQLRARVKRDYAGASEALRRAVTLTEPNTPPPVVVGAVMAELMLKRLDRARALLDRAFPPHRHDLAVERGVLSGLIEESAGRSLEADREWQRGHRTDPHRFREFLGRNVSPQNVAEIMARVREQR